MANWRKDGDKENVHKDGGSKGRKSESGGSGAGRGHGPDVTATDGGSGRSDSKRAGAGGTVKNVDYAEGGDTKMFGEQVAGSRTSTDKSKSTGKPDSSGPGEKFASGGKGKMFGFAGALPATAGITAPRES